MPKKSHVPVEVRYSSHFASVLRQKMAENNTTQKELAEYIGVRPQTLSLYCSGETQPTIEKALKVAEYYGITADYLLTGNVLDDIPVWETLGLSQNTVENIKLVKDGYFEDSPQMLYMLNYLLGDHNFYLTLERAAAIHEKKTAIKRRQQEFDEQHDQYAYVEERQEFADMLDHEDWKMARLFMRYFTDFADRDYKQMYYRTQWDRGDETWDRGDETEDGE